MKPRIDNHILLAGVAAGLGLQSCATIISGRLQTIPVTSAPAGAKVTVIGRTHTVPGLPDSFPAPAELVLHRKEKNVTLCIEKDGYRPAEVRLRRGPNGWTAVNLAWITPLAIADGSAAGKIAGGMIYVLALTLVDLATGSAISLRPARVRVVLQPADSSDPAGGGADPSKCGNPTRLQSDTDP